MARERSGPGLRSSPEHDGRGEGYGGEEDLRASVVAGGHTTPVLRPPEHDLDPVAACVAALVGLDGLAAHFRPGMQGFIPLSFNASLNQSAS